MTVLYVGDREVAVWFETPSKAELSLYSDFRRFQCVVERTKGRVTAENLADAALGLVKELVSYELSIEEQEAIVAEANALLGNDTTVDEPTPRRKFLGIF